MKRGHLANLVLASALLSSTSCAARPAPLGRDVFLRGSLLLTDSHENPSGPSVSPLPFASVRINGRCTVTPVPRPENTEHGVATPRVRSRAAPVTPTPARPSVDQRYRNGLVDRQVDDFSLEERNINAWLSYAGLPIVADQVDHSVYPPFWPQSSTRIMSVERLWRQMACRSREPVVEVVVPDNWTPRPAESQSTLAVHFYTDRNLFNLHVRQLSPYIETVFDSRQCMIFRQSNISASRFSGTDVQGERVVRQDIVSMIFIDFAYGAEIGSNSNPMGSADDCGLRIVGAFHQMPGIFSASDEYIRQLTPEIYDGHIRAGARFGDIEVHHRVSAVSTLIAAADSFIRGRNLEPDASTLSVRAYLTRYNDVNLWCTRFIEHSSLINNCGAGVNNNGQ
jgi:hypothetical protein